MTKQTQRHSGWWALFAGVLCGLAGLGIFILNQVAGNGSLPRGGFTGPEDIALYVLAAILTIGLVFFLISMLKWADERMGALERARAQAVCTKYGELLKAVPGVQGFAVEMEGGKPYIAIYINSAEMNRTDIFPEDFSWIPVRVIDTREIEAQE